MVSNIAKLKAFFTDKDGHVVLWQAPNAPIYMWIAAKAARLVLPSGQLKTAVGQFASTILFVWAYLEVTKGVSYFRKAFGLVVLVMIVMSYF